MNDFHELIQVLSITLLPFKDFPGLENLKNSINFRDLPDLWEPHFLHDRFPLTPNKQCLSALKAKSVQNNVSRIEKMFMHR